MVHRLSFVAMTVLTAGPTCVCVLGGGGVTEESDMDCITEQVSKSRSVCRELASI